MKFMDNELRKGFTLAEVLITLGIIGVVAAMTLPSLVNKYQQQESISRVKKVYSTLNQALRLSVADNGDFTEWSYDVENDAQGFVARYWTPYLLAVGGVKNPGYDEPQPFYSPNGKNYPMGVSDGSGRTRTIFKFNDGSIVWINTGSAACQTITDEDGNEQKVCDGWNFSDPKAYVDINGLKMPNVLGKDFFIMSISAKNFFVPLCHSNTDDYVNKSCSRSGDGQCCLEKLMRDNWTVKDDYPW